jgi:hypothetical protein
MSAERPHAVVQRGQFNSRNRPTAAIAARDGRAPRQTLKTVDELVNVVTHHLQRTVAPTRNQARRSSSRMVLRITPSRVSA